MNPQAAIDILVNFRNASAPQAAVTREQGTSARKCFDHVQRHRVEQDALVASLRALDARAHFLINPGQRLAHEGRCHWEYGPRPTPLEDRVDPV